MTLAPPDGPPGVIVIFPPEECVTVEKMVLLLILSPMGVLPGVVVIFSLEEGPTIILLVASSGDVSGVPPGFKNPN